MSSYPIEKKKNYGNIFGHEKEYDRNNKKEGNFKVYVGVGKCPQ